jgi:membrane associated rhomboid family serine protease
MMAAKVPMDGSGLGGLTECKLCGGGLQDASQQNTKKERCFRCDLSLKTGRPLQMEPDEAKQDRIRARHRKTVRAFHVPIPFGLYPMRHDGGSYPLPWVIWSLAGLTLLASLGFWMLGGGSSSESMAQLKTLMLWSGSEQPSQADIRTRFERLPNWGDFEEFQGRVASEVRQRIEEAPPDQKEILLRVNNPDAKVWNWRLASNRDIGDAYLELDPAERPWGRFAVHQALTAPLLHRGPVHLLISLVVLLLLGVRVNQILGQALTGALVGGCLLGGVITQMLVHGPGLPMATIGLEGVNLGLIGALAVLCPTSLVCWCLWVWFGPMLWVKPLIWRMCWALLAAGGIYGWWYWIGESAGDEDGWASALASSLPMAIAGLLIGVGLALAFLLTRLGHSRNQDLLSTALGKAAWSLVGSPRSWNHTKPMEPAEPGPSPAAAGAHRP